MTLLFCHIIAKRLALTVSTESSLTPTVTLSFTVLCTASINLDWEVHVTDVDSAFLSSSKLSVSCVAWHHYVLFLATLEFFLQSSPKSFNTTITTYTPFHSSITTTHFSFNVVPFNICSLCQPATSAVWTLTPITFTLNHICFTVCACSSCPCQSWPFFQLYYTVPIKHTYYYGTLKSYPHDILIIFLWCFCPDLNLFPMICNMRFLKHHHFCWSMGTMHILGVLVWFVCWR